MKFYEASSFSLTCFLILVAIILMALIWGAYHSDYPKAKNTILPLVVWLLLWNVLSTAFVMSDMIQKQFIPFGMIFFGVIQLSAIFFAFSSFSKIYAHLPLWMLVFFQSFRFPLELILHDWSASQTVPQTMTWTGQNFDIITGILAWVVLVPQFRTRTYIWFFNAVGFLLLLNVLRVVIFSSPISFGWNLENPIQLIAYSPYHLIGTVCVWSALVGHLILTKTLLHK